jgi:hypothetical protein
MSNSVQNPIFTDYFIERIPKGSDGENDCSATNAGAGMMKWNGSEEKGKLAAPSPVLFVADRMNRMPDLPWRMTRGQFIM